MSLHKITKISILMVSLTIIAHIYGIRINLSPSVPVGLWRLKEGEIKKGGFILFCPANNNNSQLAKERGYFSSGFCPGRLRPLIKKVVATKADKVSISNHVEVNGKAIKKSHLLNVDSLGKRLKKHFYSKILQDTELFVLGVTENSFDSRYFGVIHRSQVIESITPMWTVN